MTQKMNRTVKQMNENNEKIEKIIKDHENMEDTTYDEPPELVKNMMWLSRKDTWCKHPFWSCLAVATLLILCVLFFI